MWSWLRRKPESAERDLKHWRVLFYTRQGCHLCDDAWELVEEAQRQHGFSVTKIDVDTDPSLVEQFGECVPVVVINDKVRFRGKVNRMLLDRLLENGE